MPQKQLNTADQLALSHQQGIVERHVNNEIPAYLEIAATFSHSIHEACLEADRSIHSGKDKTAELKKLRADSCFMVDYLADFIHLRGLAIMVHNPDAVNTLFQVWRAMLVWNNRMVQLVRLERAAGKAPMQTYVDHFARLEEWPAKFGFIAKAQTVMGEEARLKV